jgi:2-oxoglutarate ferredoxin oxidoreductase subunit delta
MNAEEAADPSAVQVSKAAQARSPRPGGYVTLFGTWCKGCGLCIAFCPQGVLEANGNGRPMVAHPDKCTACHWCDTHCPDMAITVRRLEPEELEELEASWTAGSHHQGSGPSPASLSLPSVQTEQRSLRSSPLHVGKAQLCSGACHTPPGTQANQAGPGGPVDRREK